MGIKLGRLASTGINIKFSRQHSRHTLRAMSRFNFGGRHVDPPNHQIKFLAKFSGYTVVYNGSIENLNSYSFIPIHSKYMCFKSISIVQILQLVLRVAKMTKLCYHWQIYKLPYKEIFERFANNLWPHYA